MNSIDILHKIRKETDTIILFSSITGKDSILLTHYCCEVFDRVISVYMYIVKDLEHIKKYQSYFQARYKNIEYMQVPHFSLSWHIHSGFHGIRQDKTIKRVTLDDLIQQVRAKTGIEWTCIGMKKYDSIQRRFELKELEDESINRQTKRVYPLTDLSNKAVVEAIRLNRLPLPVSYNDDHSQCVEINSKEFIGWLYEKWPNDLEKVLKQYPGSKHLLYEYIKENEAI